MNHLPGCLSPDSLEYTSRVTININTNKGTLKAELYRDQAPLTVENFLYLSRSGFYKNLIFHRVVPDFVIQGGDPTGDGYGGPQYLIPSEDNSSTFIRGSIGMATSGFDTGGSQFFICQSNQPHLDCNYTEFGRIIEGIEIADKIEIGDKILSIEINTD
jgi:cyclophilin family peptidyl-prolyl cis-trans isomerase